MVYSRLEDSQDVSKIQLDLINEEKLNDEWWNISADKQASYAAILGTQNQRLFAIDSGSTTHVTSIASDLTTKELARSKLNGVRGGTTVTHRGNIEAIFEASDRNGVYIYAIPSKQLLKA